jgi:DNA polymerase-3 subunit epsilon
MREIIFDTETTGLSPAKGDRVIEIGAVELINHLPTGKTYHQYIHPETKDVDQGAFDVHGISMEFLADKPKFAEIAEDFLDFFSNGTLIAHNASFDMGFINHELKLIGVDAISNDRVLDTLQIARKKYPAGPNSLDALCSRLGINNAHRTKHGALLDSEILAEVYLELIGGRQSTFQLSSADETTARSEDYAEIVSRAPAEQRQEALPSRLKEEDLERHQKFMDGLNSDNIWKKYE